MDGLALQISQNVDWIGKCIQHWPPMGVDQFDIFYEIKKYPNWVVSRGPFCDHKPNHIMSIA